MRRFFAFMLVVSLAFSLFSVNISAYTVDDVRDLLGKERVDSKYTQEEIDIVIQQYQSIENQNLTLKMFAIGKEIDIDSELLAEYDSLEKELELAIDKFANDFEGGQFISEVLKSKSAVESVLHKIDSLRDIGYEVNVEYIPNVWTQKYEEIMTVVNEMNKFYDIGDIGEAMLPPYLGNLNIYSAFGPRLSFTTKNTIEKHNGIDYNMPVNSMVLSQWNGVVTKIYSTEKGGKTVEIAHGDNLKTVYSHLDILYVTEGENIFQYEAIGRTCDLGSEISPHLHFEVILDGEYVNPIYLYGLKGLRAFRTYASVYVDANLEIQEIEKNLKTEPSKVVDNSDKPSSSLILYVPQDGFSEEEFRKNQYGEGTEGLGEAENDNKDSNENVENNSD